MLPYWLDRTSGDLYLLPPDGAGGEDAGIVVSLHENAIL
eukprot:gene2225-2716_t